MAQSRGDVDARQHPPGVEETHRKIAIVVLGCLLLLGFILPVATLKRDWRTGKTGTYRLGVVGAVMFGVGLLIPALPKEAGRVLLLLPFVAMSHEGAAWVAFYMLLQMACVIAAAVVCLTNRPQQTFEISRSWASVAFMLIIAGIVVGVVSGLHFMIKTAPEQMARSSYFPVMITRAKLVAWWLGLGLLIPFGITDWLVGDPFAKDLKTVLDEMKHRRPRVTRTEETLTSNPAEHGGQEHDGP